MRKKKGAIEIQFNWIFVFIVGTIILLFFTRVTIKQKDVSESKIAISVLTDVDTIATGAASSRGTAQIIEIPEVDMRFTASDDDCYRTFKIGANTRQLENIFIFSPDRIEGRSLVSWTEDWSLPFRVTNLVYMTSPLVRYIIIDPGVPGGPAQQLFNNLPEEINAEIVLASEVSNIVNLNHYKVRFVYYTDPSGDPVFAFSSMDDKDVSAVLIEPDLYSDGVTGSITFFRKNGSIWRENGESFYIKEASLYGAIFSEDSYIYNCNMQAAFERLRFVSQLYLNRTTLLESTYNTQGCGTYYYLACCDSSDPKIPRIKDKAEMFSTTFPPSSISEINDLYDYAYLVDTGIPPDYLLEGVKRLNEYVLFNSCPEIY